jgi:hypothetical protein
MPHHVRVTRLVVVTAVLVAVVVTGCGRRGGLVADDGAANGAAASAAPTAGPSGPSNSPESTAPSPAEASPSTDAGTTDAPNANDSPPPESTSPGPAIAPFEAPDLTAIQRLLDELDAALGADATAATDEGSAP